MTIAIKHEEDSQTTIPRGDTIYKENDEVYFSCSKETLPKLHTITGNEDINVKNIMILGGSKIGEKSAKKLCEKKYRVPRLQ